MVEQNKIDKYVRTFAVRFSDLRYSRNDKKKTFKQISKEILDKTNVSISHAQLSKYAKMESNEQELIYPGINVILAVACYYEVPVEYLLGLTNSQSFNVTDRHTANKFGLSDKAMENLKQINDSKPELRGEMSSDIINMILENTDFLNEFGNRLSIYLSCLYEIRIDNDTRDMARYGLVKSFENLIDEMCNNLTTDFENNNQKDNLTSTGLPLVELDETAAFPEKKY